MYHSLLRRFLFRIFLSDKQTEEKYIQVNLELDSSFTLSLSDILKDFVNREVFDSKSQVFYLDPSTKRYVYADFIKTDIKLPIDLFEQEQGNNLVQSKCSKFTPITILVKNVSDETLANPKKPGKKRSKQRIISDVIRCCKQWRRLYRQVESEISHKNMTLDQSAAKVGVSRKTLQDYYLQIKNGKRLNFDFCRFKDQKMGVLRNYVKQNSSKMCQVNIKSESSKFKSKAQIDEQQQRELFKYLELKLGKQDQGKEMQQQIYQEQIDVGEYLLSVDSQSRSGNSSQSQ